MSIIVDIAKVKDNVETQFNKTPMYLYLGYKEAQELKAITTVYHMSGDKKKDWLVKGMKVIQVNEMSHLACAPF